MRGESISDILYLISGGEIVNIWHLVSGIGYLESNTWHLIPGISYLAFSVFTWIKEKEQEDRKEGNRESRRGAGREDESRRLK